MRRVAILLGTLALADCSGAAQRTIYLRTDGQDIASNPALGKQLDLDRKACESEGDDKACMAVKGYVSVAPDMAAAKQQQLAAMAAQNAALKDVAVLPLPTPTGPHNTAVAKKQKETAPTPSQD
jgi:hypothetical protein